MNKNLSIYTNLHISLVNDMFDMYLRLLAMQSEINSLKKMSEKDFRKWKKR